MLNLQKIIMIEKSQGELFGKHVTGLFLEEIIF